MPYTQDGLPFSGETKVAAHSSHTGAVHATKARGEKVEALRQLLRNHGPLTFNEIAAITGWPISSVCSLKSAIKHEVQEDGFDEQRWGDGTTTRRTRWRLKR